MSSEARSHAPNAARHSPSTVCGSLSPALAERSKDAVIRPKRIEYTFRIQGWNYETVDETRVVHSMFDAEDIAVFKELGYLLVTDVVDAAKVKAIKAALEIHRSNMFGSESESGNPVESQFQGQYVRDLMTRDATLMMLLEPEPIVDSVRSLLGPCISLRGSTGLVLFPNATRSGTGWHADHLVATDPPPPIATRIPRIGCMLYLEDISEHLGPTYVIPGSHHVGRIPEWFPERDPPSVALTPTAGSVLFFDVALWHRGGVNATVDEAKRAIIWQFAPGGTRRIREAPMQVPPESLAKSMIDRATAAGDRGFLELMSQVWYD